MDFRPLIFQKYISDLLQVKTEESAETLCDYKFNKLEFSRMCQGLLQ